MALHVPKAPGFSQMLKDGARHFSGLEEAVYRNINACKDFAETVRSAYGPNGMNKIIINHIEKLFITNDAATIIRELEVEHPAAKLMILASQMQEQEVGDGTNFVIIFAGNLLECAEGLLRMGLTPVEVGEGYERACEKALEILPEIVCNEIKDYRNADIVAKAMKASLMSKQYGNEEFLSKLITDACVAIVPENVSFNVDHIRVCKILGGGLMDSTVINGMVFKRHVEGEVIKKSKAKIAVFTGPIDIGTTETKGTVLIKTAEELKQFSAGEENMLEKQINAIKETGADVIVSGAKFSDMALHFINKAGMMAVKLPSKFDIRRLCKTTNATALPFLTPPSKEELGYIDEVYVDELGDTSVIVFKMEGRESRISTIVIRGSTDNYMDDIERAIDDGVNTFKCFTKDGRLVAGAGSCEIELARRIREYGETLPGLEQYSVQKFADALEMLPKAISDNSGLKTTELLASLNATHQQGNTNHGINIEGDSEKQLLNAHEEGIWDTFVSKHWGMKYAVNAATTILRVDQIIMAKRAGGPAPPKPKGGDNDDD